MLLFLDWEFEFLHCYTFLVQCFDPSNILFLLNYIYKYDSANFLSFCPNNIPFPSFYFTLTFYKINCLKLIIALENILLIIMNIEVKSYMEKCESEGSTKCFLSRASIILLKFNEIE